jgi:antitoxin component YwqK of YwqJK toxin-antitoxin module
MFSVGRTTYYNGQKKYESWPKGRRINDKPFLLLHQSVVWCKNGNMKSKVLYDPREPETNKQICWYSNGQKKSEGRHYLVEHRWMSGSAKGGKWIFWYEDGQKKSEGVYGGGVKREEWTYWDIDGNKTIKFEHRSI